jgi:hypothetical protein
MSGHKPIERYFSEAEIAERYGITLRSLFRWLRHEKFPKPDFRLPGGQPRWSDRLISDHERSAVSSKPAA